MSGMGFGPGGIDCEDVLKDLYLLIDDEVSDDTRCRRMKEHLHECGPCLRQYGLEQDVKSLIARRCGSDVAPVQLKTKILASITEITVTSARREYLPE